MRIISKSHNVTQRTIFFSFLFFLSITANLASIFEAQLRPPSSSCSHFPKLVKNVVSRVISSCSCIKKRIFNVRIKIKELFTWLLSTEQTRSIDFWETLLMNNLMATRNKKKDDNQLPKSEVLRSQFAHTVSCVCVCGRQQIKQWLRVS